ncbi:sodium/proline symporter [Rubrobacter radiotolerans]|uniref:Sodium/proline symporter n=1 Tax=Rubrobacter radiotolerans TaxID=42256 RepID=A0A023WZH8_RUBRA|nr:sodium/proline symporter PutP [Rubrobacter radiotolerans]AHY45602.1 sodium/proline symporter [Rubrobacter radiotolerans]MDX5893015.1 sodium/proline symporter PutP [Rubrobacter radiotolerans]SMC02905.1 sodium/proline symporter [Rubrobacter radiotolerans DSM 5868]
MPASFPALVTFGVYLIGMLGIGVWVYQRNKNLSDFVIGGRTLGSWVAALSAQASDMSGWLLLGLPGAAYVGGLGAGWIALGLAVGTYFNWRLIASRLRVYTERAGALQHEGGSITLSEYFENRFEDRSHLLRVISALVIIVFYSIYVASGLVAGGILFNEIFGIDTTLAITIAVLVIVSYTFLGGFLAVSFTDFFQGSLMWLALMVVPVIVILSIGGFNPLVDGLEAKEPALLSPLGNVSIEDGGWIATGSLGLVLILSGLGWGLGYFGQPHILARFMGIRSAREVPRARIIAMVWVLTALTASMFIGLIAIEYFGEQLANPETAFIRMVQEVFNPWIAGILLAAVLAAIMSTADSQLLVASSALSEDFYRTFLNRDASDAVLLWVGRITVIAVAIVAYTLALGGGTVLDLVAYAWAGFGAAFGPLIVMSLFWRRMNRWGALAGMVGGAATVVLWRQLDPFGWGLYEILPGFAVGIVLIVIFSLIGPEPSEQMNSDFDLVNDNAEGRS